MKHFAANLAVCRQRWPELGRLLLQVSSADLQVYQTTSNEISAAYLGRSLNSRYRPRQEAQRWLTAKWNNGASASVMFGLGLGYAAEIYQRNWPKIPLILVELDLSLLRRVLELRDLRSVLCWPQLTLCWQEQDFNSRLLVIAGCRIQLFQLPWYQQLATYKKLAATLLRFVEQNNLQINTINRFGRCWIRNICANLHLLPQIFDASQPFKALAAKPALIIAAGPSLQDLLPQLAQLQRHCYLLAVDTTLLPLRRYNIRPDFIFSVDPQLSNSWHLRPEGCPEAVLVSDLSCHPSILRLRWRQILLSASPIPFARFWQQQLGKPATIIRSGGTVTSFAWDWARQAQMAPLILAGCDFAFSKGRSHCSGSRSQQALLHDAHRFTPAEQLNWHSTLTKDSCTIPTPDGTTNRSSKQLQIYANWLEQQIEHLQLASCWQLTSPETPLLKGCRPVTTEQLLTLPYCNRYTKTITRSNDAKLRNKLARLLTELTAEFANYKHGQSPQLQSLLAQAGDPQHLAAVYHQHLSQAALHFNSQTKMA